MSGNNAERIEHAIIAALLVAMFCLVGLLLVVTWPSPM